MLVLKLDMVVTNVLLKQTASYFVIVVHGSSVHAVFRCLENIRPSITQKIIWEINSEEGANVFCSATQTLVQGPNDANKMGQAFV